MEKLYDLFIVTVSKNKLEAQLDINEEKLHTAKDVNVTYEKLKQLLQNKRIVYGINHAKLTEIAERFSPEMFPVTIARGVDKEDGKDGEINYVYDRNTKVDRSENWDFRDVMRIPTVKAGEKIAEYIPPTKGKEGISVHGEKINPRPGKRPLLRPGKNVIFREEDSSFYAQEQGQITEKRNKIHVYTVYEVPESISMKIGNIDFAGSVIIRGDVPSGFTIKATGDIKIFGIVEAAKIIADGSIYISEGMAGLKEGILQAGEDVHIGYINQGNVRAGNSILVENSILHSECSAVNDIICKRGNIIGGSLSAGNSIIGKDVGNRLNTLTHLSFGVEKNVYEEQQQIEKEIKANSENLEKMYVLQQRLQETKEQVKNQKITMLKLRHSIEKTKEKITHLKEELEEKQAELGNINEAQLIVKGKIYPNVVISFGKYQRTIDKQFSQVLICMYNNEIAVQTYHMSY